MTPGKWILTVLTSIIIAAGGGWIAGVGAKGNDLEIRVRAVENKASVTDERFATLQKRMDELSIDMKATLHILQSARR